MLTVMIACVAKPSWGGKKIQATWGQRFASTVHLAPPMGIFLLVVGSIYAGPPRPPRPPRWACWAR